MRLILVAGVALAMTACSGGDSADEANDANALAADNMMLDSNLMMDANAAGMAGTNGAVDATTQNLMEQDARTHDPDTNLANGL